MKRKEENKLTIKIPRFLHELSEVSYDEDSDNFSITITSKNNKINPSDLIFDAPITTKSKEKSSQFTQVLGRALARTRENKLFLSSWSFVSTDDLKKTKTETTSPTFFHNILEEIIRNTSPQALAIIFWQDKRGVWSIIKPNSRNDVFEKMKEISSFSYKNNYLLAGPYTNFSEAEMEIRRTIKKAVQ